MSLCLHHLLRLRLSSRLQSCAPQHRILSLGHWHQSRTYAQSSRHVIKDARYSNNGSEVGHADNELVGGAAPQDCAVSTAPPSSHAVSSSNLDTCNIHDGTYRTDGNLESHVSVQLRPGQYPYRGRTRGRFAPTVSQLSATREPNLRYIQLRERREIAARNKSLDLVIKSKSMYTFEPGYRHWRRAFDLLYTATHHKKPPTKSQAEALFTVQPEQHRLIEMIQTDCFGLFRRTWEGMEIPVKASHWRSLALWLLEYSPLSTPEFLFVTAHSNHKPDYNMFVDCFRFLGNLYHEPLKQWTRESLTYSSVVQICLDPKIWSVRGPDRGFRLHALHSGHQGLCSALETEKERPETTYPEHLLNLVKRFIGYRDVDRALEGLRYLNSLNRPGFELNSVGVQRHCCKLLMLDTVIDGPQGRNFHILPRLLAMGVRPDTDMMNIVLLNAFKTGDSQVGLDVLSFMRGQDYGLDAYTYSILLTDAVSSGDRERVVTLMQEIERRPEIRRNPYVTSKLMHAHFVFTARHVDTDAEPSRIFYAMLDIYNQLHDITPLKELLILPPEYTSPVEGPKEPPSMMALYILIATFFRCQSRFSNVERIYMNFRSLVLQGHETIAPLAATDHTYNEFLVALRRSSHGLRLSVRILEDMMHSPPDITLESGKTINHVTPRVRTWTILLSAFIYNRQPFAAEKVKEMMVKHNVRFNQVTWNTIISGYANAQQIPETAKAIRIMEEQGFEVDQFTMRSLRYLNDPERLWEVMDEFDRVSQRSAEAAAASASASGPTSEPLRSKYLEDETKQREELLEQGLRRLMEKKKSQAEAKSSDTL